ncbi:hypothetical protein GF386_01150 [Candidatus Pacearchaeota archaeon]|nr:hypothetical protein [Candidatus Pacearchaeota archaeon]
MKKGGKDSRPELVFNRRILPNSERSQTTVFVIIGILLFIIILGFVFLKTSENLSFLSQNRIPMEVQPVYDSIDSCVYQRTVDAIRLIGLQGGYVIIKNFYVETELTNVSYGYYNKKKILASKQEIEKEIEFYLENVLSYCVNPDYFPGHEIIIEKEDIDVKINNGFVFVSADMPMSVKKQDETFVIDKKYQHEIPVKLGKIHDVAEEIINKEIENPGYIDITYISNLEFDVLFIPYDDDTIVYSITDDSSVNEIPYTFLFAMDIK